MNAKCIDFPTPNQQSIKEIRIYVSLILKESILPINQVFTGHGEYYFAQRFSNLKKQKGGIILINKGKNLFMQYS